MTVIAIIIITAACFFAAVLNLAAENRFRNRIVGAFMTIAIFMGLAIYGYGFAYRFGPTPTAVLRALMALCRMFGGVNDLGSIEAAPLFAHDWAIAVFWAVHFMAFYVTASTAIATIGGKVLRRIRVTLLRRGTLLIIYGINASSVEYGQRQLNERRRSVVFIGRGEASLESAVNAAGGVIEKNGEEPDAALLRRLGVRGEKRRIEIAALHDDGFNNVAFAQSMLKALEGAGVRPEQTALLIRGMDEEPAGKWVASGSVYGYGSVMAFDEYELVARLMAQEAPPCDAVRFDESGRAAQDFNALIIGFGRMGRAALKSIVMNGQFCGSSFRTDIFDGSAQNGMLHDHALLRQYDVRFHGADAKSDAFYSFLEEQKDAVRYIVICTGDEKENREIARDVDRWMRARGAFPLIVQCSKRGILFVRAGEIVQRSVYGSSVLDLETIDRRAMAINHSYCRDSGKTMQESWRECDYFSRMSSRASADFYSAVLRAAGSTEEQALKGEWPPPDGILENLSITEHMRWCAFHYVMGFVPMDEAEYAERIERYRSELREAGASSLRIGKDMENRKHACLVPWEALDALSERENAVTGGQVDYKQMDRNNILALPDILRAAREASEKYEGGRTA